MTAYGGDSSPSASSTGETQNSAHPDKSQSSRRAPAAGRAISTALGTAMPRRAGGGRGATPLRPDEEAWARRPRGEDRSWPQLTSLTTRPVCRVIMYGGCGTSQPAGHLTPHRPLLSSTGSKVGAAEVSRPRRTATSRTTADIRIHVMINDSADRFSRQQQTAPQRRPSRTRYPVHTRGMV